MKKVAKRNVTYAKLEGAGEGNALRTGPAAGFKPAAGEAFSEWTGRYQPAM